MTFLDRLTSVFFEKQDSLAKAIIHSCSVEAGTVGLMTAQIPGDRFVIGGIQVDMVQRLARVYDRRLDRAGVLAVLNAAAAVTLAPEAVNQIVKYVPFLGNVVNMSVAGGVTEAIGWSAVRILKDEKWFNKGAGSKEFGDSF